MSLTFHATAYPAASPLHCSDMESVLLCRWAARDSAASAECIRSRIGRLVSTRFDNEIVEPLLPKTQKVFQNQAKMVGRVGIEPTTN